MPSILCIEDEVDLREEVVESLRESGYETYEASNGTEGMDIIFRMKPDLVLCDITMPKMNGFELLDTLRVKHPELANTPFVFLSALADRTDVISGKQLGADDYLIKPVDFDNLQATIKSRLGQVERMNILKERELSEVREEVMLVLPHELRTPLNHIIGFSELIKEEFFGPIGNEKYLEYAQEIHKAGNNLNETVKNVLELADVVSQRRKPKIEHCNIADCIEEVFQYHSGQADRDEISLICEVFENTPMVSGDRSLVCQVLSALVSNAIKFSTSDGRVELVVGKASDPGWVQIEIRDRGFGIPSSGLEEVLKPFSQLDKGMNRRFDGLGIGLTLAKVATECMGGSFDITSVINMGTTVILVLPEWTGECIN